MGSRLKLEGHVFGKLTVISYAGSSFWNCECKCGKVNKVRTADLRNKNTEGCRSCANRFEEQGLAGFNRLFSKYKKRAKIFSLSAEEFRFITSSKCHYCGVEPYQISTHSPSKGDITEEGRKYASYVYNGIDKKDPNGGYTLDNSLPCCKLCNFSKRDLSYDEFLDYLNRLTNFRGKK